jgi:hypothetical protein
VCVPVSSSRKGARAKCKCKKEKEKTRIVIDNKRYEGGKRERGREGESKGRKHEP